MIRKILSFALLLAIFILLALSLVLVRDFSSVPQGPAGRVIFEVTSGESVHAVARSLQSKKIIRRSWTFLAAYKLFYPRRKLKAGEYELILPLKTKDVLMTLLRGKVYLHPLTIPEGMTLREIDALIRQTAFPIEGSFYEAGSDTSPIVSWDDRAKDLEGYLFPDTYHFPKNTPAQITIRSMVEQFQKVFGPEGLRRAAELHFPVRSIVILASMIEKESALPEEKPLVSAVFHNRLKIGMKLDCDPTIIYALKQDGRYRGRLLSKDLKYASPYNTYLYPGLPPGPICNPGRESLQAALYPAHRDFLYFVARNDGGHIFSRSYQEHLQAVRKFQLKKKSNLL